MNTSVDFPAPYLIDFSKLGEPAVGYISVAQPGQGIPFEVKRVFWTYYTPESILRGRHAHYRTEQVLVAVCGRIIVTAESPDGEIRTFSLEQPNVGVYLPPNVWHTMQYSHNSVQLVLASTPFDEQDYIRQYADFRRIWAG